MNTFQFTMTYNGKTVAEGRASAVMVYEFQKAFMASIAPSPNIRAGKFATLQNLLARKVGENEIWDVSMGGDMFVFECVRVE